jgi:hypothetical protein
MPLPPPQLGVYTRDNVRATRGSAHMHESCMLPRMRTTLVIDENPLERARQLTGIRKETVLVRAGLEALIAREGARHLAAPAGAEPGLRAVLRRRAGASR